MSTIREAFLHLPADRDRRVRPRRAVSAAQDRWQKRHYAWYWTACLSCDWVLGEGTELSRDTWLLQWLTIAAHTYECPKAAPRVLTLWDDPEHRCGGQWCTADGWCDGRGGPLVAYVGVGTA